MSNMDIGNEKFGMIGIGLVGTSLAELLIDNNFHVVGYDIDEEKLRNFKNIGGEPAKSSSEVSNACDTIILSLMTTDIVNEVIFGENGILKSSSKPKVIIDTTTGDPFKVDKIAEKLEKNWG
jgi:3-hydroxyisobutyrate dehydrogenase